MINAECHKIQSQADMQSSVKSTRLDGLMNCLLDELCTTKTAVGGNTMMSLSTFMKISLFCWTG